MKTPLTGKLIPLLLAGFCVLPTLSQAAKRDKADNPRAQAIQQRMQEVSKELGLTDQQKEQLKPILQSEFEKLAALRKDANLSRRDKAERLKAIRDEIAPQVKTILTPEQFAKWEKIKADGRERLRERVRGGRTGGETTK